MKTRSMFLFLMMILLCFANVYAQESVSVECSADDISASITSSKNILEQAQIASTAGKTGEALAMLSQIEKESRTIQSKCNGLHFEGDGNDSIGPLELEAGVYILEYSTQIADSQFVLGVFGAEFENIDKEELNFDSVLETYSKAGDNDGRKTVRLEGGRYLLSITSQGVNQWALNIVKP